MAVLPVLRGLRHVLASPRLRKQRRRAVAVTFGSAAAALVLVLAVPLPYHTDAEGVVWLSEQAMVRAGASGFMVDFLAAPGTRVAAGDAVLRTHDPALESQLRLNEAKVAELEAAYAAEFVDDRARAQIVRDKLEGARAALARAEERAGEAIVRVRADGVFLVPQAGDLPGRYYRKGELLGYVIGAEPPLVRVVVPQDSVDPVRVATDRILVRLVDRPALVLEGRMVRQVPGGEAYLPSRALATEGGGQIATDPRDSSGPKALERMFQFDVALEGAPPLAVFGERAYLRFEHRREPLAARWYRDLRRLFLSRFGV
jgi:putative peptide zinc metalloprotease protein